VKKVEAIRDSPRPFTKKQVCTFVGLTSYYRRFIPQSLASPLTDLTRSHLPDKVKWTEETEKAFRSPVVWTRADDPRHSCKKVRNTQSC